MKTIIALLILFSFGFSDYKVTYYYPVLTQGETYRIWITEGFDKTLRFTGLMNYTCVHFIDKKTGKKVTVSMPFTVEEL